MRERTLILTGGADTDVTVLDTIHLTPRPCSPLPGCMEEMGRSHLGTVLSPPYLSLLSVNQSRADLTSPCRAALHTAARITRKLITSLPRFHSHSFSALGTEPSSLARLKDPVTSSPAHDSHPIS